ncbi:prepilin peptidase [bacterium]|nr:MAG: prepilin peptidase [bacterium]
MGRESQRKPVSWLTLAVLAAALAVHVTTDLREGYVYDVAVYPPLLVLAALAWGAGRLADGCTGALACAAVPAALTAVTRGRGMGIGDAKVAGLMGMALGPSAGVLALGCSFMWGAGVALALVAVRRLRWGARMAFVPFLGLGFLTVVFMQHAGVR